MDMVENKAKMGSAILVAAAGAIFGACVAYFISLRHRKRKPSAAPNEEHDTVETLRGELEDCRKTLDEFRQILEQETERRNESEAWNRKLEQDLVDLAAARKSAEEKCVRLCRDLDKVKTKLKAAETQEQQLKNQIRDLNYFVDKNSNTMPSATAELPHLNTDRQKPKILPKSRGLSLEQMNFAKADDNFAAIPANFCFTDPKSSGFSKDKITNPVEDLYAENQQNNKDLQNSEDDFPDEDEDYSEEELDLDDSDIAILQRNISQVSDDNFELGVDVMGALIANAFKDGVIESRDGDDVSLSEEISPQHQKAVTPDMCSNGQKSHEKGEVSQESIGDIKTTRRFWEQMIAADKVKDDDEDVSYDSEDITDDDDELTDEDEEDFIQNHHASCVDHESKCGKQERQMMHNDDGQLHLESQNVQGTTELLKQSNSCPIEDISNGVGVNGRGNGEF